MVVAQPQRRGRLLAVPLSPVASVVPVPHVLTVPPVVPVTFVVPVAPVMPVPPVSTQSGPLIRIPAR